MLSKPSRIYLLFEGAFNFADKTIAPVFVVFLQSFSLTSAQIGVLLSVSNWVTAFLDFPTGALSDLKGRKLTSTGGLFLFGIGLLIYGLGKNFSTFVVALSLMGAGFAFVSGSITAWYLHEIKKIGLKSEIHRVFSLSTGFSSAISALAGVVAGIAASVSLRLPFLIGGAVACVMAAVCFFVMPENYGTQNKKHLAFMSDTIKTFWGAPFIRRYVYLQVLAEVGFCYFILSWQPYLMSFGLKASSLGFVFTLMMVAGAIVGLLLSRYMNHTNNPGVVALSVLLMGVAFIGMCVGRSLAAAVLSTLLYQCALAIKMPAHAAWLNGFLKDENRAAILSAISTCVSVFTALFFIGLGVWMQHVPFKAGFILPAVALFIATLLAISMDRTEIRVTVSEQD